jgi:hypothetical protein
MKNQYKRKDKKIRAKRECRLTASSGMLRPEKGAIAKFRGLRKWPGE